MKSHHIRTQSSSSFLHPAGLASGRPALLSVHLSLTLSRSLAPLPPGSSNRIHRGALTAVAADRGSLPFRWLSRNLNSPVDERVSAGEQRRHETDREKEIAPMCVPTIARRDRPFRPGNNTAKMAEAEGVSDLLKKRQDRKTVVDGVDNGSDGLAARQTRSSAR